jgi:hypothetical protein
MSSRVCTYAVCEPPAKERFPLYVSGLRLEVVEKLDKGIEENTISPLKREFIYRRFFIGDDATELLWKRLDLKHYAHEILDFEIRKEIPHDFTGLLIEKGNPEKIFRWFINLPKDEELADILDETVKEMRARLRLL